MIIWQQIGNYYRRYCQICSSLILIFFHNFSRTYCLVDLMEWTIVLISKTVTSKCSYFSQEFDIRDRIFIHEVILSTILLFRNLHKICICTSYHYTSLYVLIFQQKHEENYTSKTFLNQFS